MRVVTLLIKHSMTNKQREILVTSALPYANGSIHLGHMLEHIQSDIWVRYHKLRQRKCTFVCADDTHGTPVMLRAQQMGIAPEEMIERTRQEHQQDFIDFLIEYDNYYSTHSKESQFYTHQFYNKLNADGHISRRTISQLFDPEKEMFLPDRFVKGDCPKCGAPDQYGDNCDVCGATYSPTDLKNPRSVVSGATPIMKDSEHFFFELPHFESMLTDWLNDGHVQDEVANKLHEWLKDGLKAWDISRDKPYFGIEIPGQPGKYFYVWLDAPIGYIASFKNLCDRRDDLDFDHYWKADSTTELYHFIGKDITYFHCLFWPATLTGAGFRTPTAVNAHGFLTVNGTKMSKSKGTFVNARTYLNHMKPEYLRYYLAAKLSARLEDFDLNLEDFVQRVNSDLVGKLVNIASRTSGFIAKRFDNSLSEELHHIALLEQIQAAKDKIADHYEQREYSKAIREIMLLTDQANQYIAEQMPWSLVKNPETALQAHQVCSTALNAFRLLVIYLKPVLPELAQKTEHFLNVAPFTWTDIDNLLKEHGINTFKPMMQRLEVAQIERMIEDSIPTSETTPVKPVVEATAAKPKAEKQSMKSPTEAATNETTIEPIAEMINIEDFAKIDLRIAKIVKAEHVESANKLLRLELDIGLGTRQVFAGIKSAYSPEQLEGKLTVMVANLQPRKMRFGESQGMVLAAGPGGDDLYILNPDQGATPGMRVK